MESGSWMGRAPVSGSVACRRKKTIASIPVSERRARSFTANRVVPRIESPHQRSDPSHVRNGRDGERELDGPCARVRIRLLKEKVDDRYDSRFREEGTIFHGKPRRPADRVAAPAEGPQPCPHRTGGTQRPVRGCDRVVESRGHHVNDRYNSRVLAAIRSHVKFRRTCRRPAFPIFAPVWGSSKIRVIARPSFAGSPGGTSSPVSSFTTTSLMPPTRVATTGVSQAIASRLMIPNGS